MGKKLYIGNLPFSVDDERLREIFESFGEIISAKVIFDKDTGRSKGFGFIEFDTQESASNAMAQMHGANVDGRNLSVSEAREERSSGPRGGGFDRGPRREGGGGYQGGGGRRSGGGDRGGYGSREGGREGGRSFRRAYNSHE